MYRLNILCCLGEKIRDDPLRRQVWDMNLPHFPLSALGDL